MLHKRGFTGGKDMCMQTSKQSIVNRLGMQRQADRQFTYRYCRYL